MEREMLEVEIVDHDMMEILSQDGTKRAGIALNRIRQGFDTHPHCSWSLSAALDSLIAVIRNEAVVPITMKIELLPSED